MTIGDLTAPTFVLVHGGWHGGWCWRRVAAVLRAAGHECHTPTLTGLGDRAHLRKPLGEQLGLHTHVRDVASLLVAEDLRDVVLVGHSYAGLVVEGAADLAPDRVARLVHLDSFVPAAGQSLFDLLPPQRREFYESQVRDGAVDPPPVAALGITDPDTARRVAERLTPQPLATFAEAVVLTGAAQPVPRCYVRCTEGPLVSTFAPFATRARSDPAWDQRDLRTAHDAMLTVPDELAALLASLADQ